MLHPESKSKRKSKNYRLLPEAIVIVNELADYYTTTNSRVVEALIIEHDSRILERAKTRKEKDND
jgi:hypothetical protein